MTRGEQVIVRALRTRQATSIDVYEFFIRGAQVAQIADISRLRRGDGELEGFQRREIKSHVAEIAEFLAQGPVLFPNAIILALSPEVRFEQSRGPKIGDDAVIAGKLSLPLRPEGQRAAWIVDGQQRSLALAKAKDCDLLVPVVAFVSADVAVQREQFILVNKARPLPPRLIDELLPEMTLALPRDLKARQVPSALCSALHDDPKSPFHGLIKRGSEPGAPTAVVTDRVLIDTLVGNLRAGGALGAYRAGDGLEPLHEALCTYWQAVREAFPDAWGRPAGDSRLMHSAGIRAMGALMDPVWTRADATADPASHVRESLARLAPYCRWTEGVWGDLGWGWNDLQATSRHIKGLTEYLLQLDRSLARPSR
ncbi:DGQHR domain-containing protein DpdB [Phenylobacterium sp.]|uniref:DGQHR domain-containing protein DpdB n=1 Tax=Phenylobacterium sp. TaxID=1871053 RepID=UPI00356572D9